MNKNILFYLIIISAVLFAGIVIAYLMISKKKRKGEDKYIRQLREGTKEKSFS